MLESANALEHIALSTAWNILYTYLNDHPGETIFHVGWGPIHFAVTTDHLKSGLQFFFGPPPVDNTVDTSVTPIRPITLVSTTLPSVPVIQHTDTPIAPIVDQTIPIKPLTPKMDEYWAKYGSGARFEVISGSLFDHAWTSISAIARSIIGANGMNQDTKDTIKDVTFDELTAAETYINQLSDWSKLHGGNLPPNIV